MKIYECIVMDWDGWVLEEHYFEYEGELALCGGGGGKSRPKVQKAPPVPEPTKTPTGESAAIDNDARRKAAAAAGLSGTNVTGGSLGGQAGTQKKSLMGQ